MAFDPGLADRVRSILKRACVFEEKKMFGGMAYMVNGKMCCGVVQSDLVLRLGPEASEAALKKRHTRPMDFTGKPMKSMIYVAPAGTDSDSELEKWLLLAVGFAQQAAERPKRRAVR